jgi:hypothetical protein
MGPDRPSISAVLLDSTVVIQAGKSASLVLTADTRALDEPLVGSVEHLPAGMMATFIPASISGAHQTVTISLSALRSVTPGELSQVEIVLQSGDTRATIPLRVTVTPPEDFIVAIAGPISVAAGASARMNVTVARTGGFAGIVSLRIDEAPAGVDATVDASIAPAATTGMLVINAALGAAGTTGALRLVASAAGVRDDTVQVDVTVTAHTTRTTLTFCGASIPTWFAFQNEGAPWVRVTGQDGVFTFDATDRVATAHVVEDGIITTQIAFATPEELMYAPQPSCAAARSRTVSGMVAGLGPADAVRISINDKSVFIPRTSSSKAFTITGLPDGPVDLVATRITCCLPVDSLGVAPELADQVVIRRSINPPSGGSLPVLDFGSGESRATIPALLRSTTYNIVEWTGGAFTTANGTTHGMPVTQTPKDALWRGIPNALLQSGDYQSATVRRRTIHASDGYSTRTTYFRETVDQVMDPPSLPGVLSVTTVSSTPYVRVSVGAGGSGVTRVHLQQNPAATITKSVILVGSSSYWPTSAAMTIPDFTAVDGWNNAWGLRPGIGTGWSRTTHGGRSAVFFGAPPQPGEQIDITERSGWYSALPPGPP